MAKAKGLPLVCALGAAFGLAMAQSSFAAPPPISIAATGDTTQADTGPFGFVDGLNRSSQMLGDLWGLRTMLGRYGMTLSIQETSEVLGNLSGGYRRGFEYDGLTQAVLQLNTQRAFGHYGGLFNISALQIHGQNISADNLGSLQTASGIESDRATRLWELWYDQKFLDEDRLDIKVGQQSLDQEFMVSTNALLFVNTMFGWPMLPSADLPGGGPAYPLSALGVRVGARPIDGVNILAGVFNGSPAPNPNGDPQQQDPSGTSFPTNGGTLTMAEVQFSYPTLGSMVEPGDSPPLGWTYRLGGWYDSESFNDERFDVDGIHLASPVSSGQPRTHKGDYAFYGVADQLVWRDDTDPNRTISVFARLMGTPLADRNLIDFSANLGAVFHSPIRYRTDDTLGIGFGYAHVSSVVAAMDRDVSALNGGALPVRTSEKFIEVTYQYQVKPWMQLQPDIQYVINPGGGIQNPFDPSTRVKDELVVGVRTNISF